MGIKIYEETMNSCTNGTFLPPTVYEVRRFGRSVLSLVTACLFTLAALLISAHEFVLGFFVIPSALLVLFATLFGFKASGKLNGGYGISLQAWCYLASAVILLAYAILYQIDSTRYLLDRISLLLDRFSTALPEPFDNIINSVVSNFDMLSAMTAICFLSIALSFGVLDRSRCKNIPCTKLLFLSVLVNSGFGAWFIHDTLERLHLIPSNYIYEDWTLGMEISRYCDAAISLLLAAVLMLFAVRLLIIYIRMRKVKNAVLKA